MLSSAVMTSSSSCLLLLISCLISIASSAPTECDRMLIQSDNCIRKAMLFGEANTTFPGTDQQVTRYCQLGEEHMRCVKSYGKCLKPFPRQVFSIMIRNMRQLMRETCDTEQGRMEFMQHSTCMSKDNTEKLHRLMNKMTIHLNFVHKNTTKDQKIPYMCCSIIIGREEMEKTVNQMCGSAGRDGGSSNHHPSRTVQYVNRLFNQAVGEAVDLGCGSRYGTEDACRQQIGSQGWTALKTIINDDNYSEQETSFLIPVVGITKELDSL